MFSDKDYRVNEGYNGALVNSLTLSFPPTMPLKSLPPTTSCHTSPHFSSHASEWPGIKMWPMLIFDIVTYRGFVRVL
jgi:hypothetical protein